MAPRRRTQRSPVSVIVPKSTPVTGGKFKGEGKTTAAGRDLIVQALAKGLSVSEVARTLGLSRKTVRHWKKCYATTGEVTPKRAGGPRRTARTPMAARSMRAELKKGCPTWNVLRARMAAKGHNMSKTTVRQLAKEQGGHSVSVNIKPPLSPETKAKRLTYAKKQVKRPAEGWRRVVFLDEAACSAVTSRRVIKHKSQSVPTRHVDKRAAKVHFAGYISAAGKKSKLHVLPPGKTWTATNLLPIVRSLKRTGVEVVLDGASPHRKLKRALKNAGAVVLDHPPYSPDLNAIENIWAVVKAKAALKNPNTHDELVKALKDAWAEVSPTEFRAFAESMKRRMELVVETGGEHTKY